MHPLSPGDPTPMHSPLEDSFIRSFYKPKSFEFLLRFNGLFELIVLSKEKSKENFDIKMSNFMTKIHEI